MTATAIKTLRWHVTDRSGSFVASNFSDHLSAFRWCQRTCQKLGKKLLVWSPDHLVTTLVAPWNVSLRGERGKLDRENGRLTGSTNGRQMRQANREALDGCSSPTGAHRWERLGAVEHKCADCGVIGGEAYMGRIQSRKCYRKTRGKRCSEMAKHLIPWHTSRVAVCDAHLLMLRPCASDVAT